jgi:hypothetical protein
MKTLFSNQGAAANTNSYLTSHEDNERRSGARFSKKAGIFLKIATIFT